MLCTVGMLISREPEVEVVLLVKLNAIIFTLVCYLRYGHRSLWLAPITSAMLCYAMLCIVASHKAMYSFNQYLDFWPLCQFTPWMFRYLDHSPPGLFATNMFHQGWGRTSQETCTISETGQVRTKVSLLLISNRKLHACFRLVSKSTTLDDFEGPLCTQFQKTRLTNTPRKFE